MTNKEKKSARIVGALFLIAMATSLIGAALIESPLSAPDYLVNISTNETQVITGVLLELVDGIAVIGIAVMMFPIFRKQDEALALGYVAFRIVEAVIIFAALISPLALITFSQEYMAVGPSAAANFDTLGASFIAVRTHLLGQMLGIFFSVGALVFYYLLYQLKLVPRWISVWGLIAVVLVLTWNLLELASISFSAGIVLGLPIILNEIFLGIWLIVKGFNPSTLLSEPAEVDIDVAYMTKSS